MARQSAAARRDHDRYLSILGLLVLVAALFVAIVGVGWYWLLNPVVPASPLAGLAAVLITTIALLCARFIGQQKAAEDTEPDGDGGRRPRTWWSLYPFLFLISAMGTINLAFYNFEGTDVLQQNTDTARIELSRLSTTAHQLLLNKDFETKKSQVNGLLDKLSGEILNPNGRSSCGVGPVAKTVIGQITSILPDFAESSWGDNIHKCGSAALHDLDQDYRRRAMVMLNQDPAFVSARGPEKANYLANLDRDLGAAEEGLKQAEAGLASRNGTHHAVAYLAAQHALETADDRYSVYRSQLEQLAGAPVADLPPSLDIGASRSLGSITSILSTLMSRLGRWTTYFYFLIALALDLALIFLFAAQAEGASSRKRTIIVTGQARPGRDPEFLWVNPY